MKYISIGLVTIFVFWFFGCTSAPETTKENPVEVVRSGSKTIQLETQSDTYILRQGDQIQLSVWGYPEFNASGIVRENGMFTVPLVGDVLAIGSTKEQFIQRLQKKLEEYIQGEIKLSVTVLSTTMQKVAVLGTVNHQDNYAVTSDMTLLAVLTIAGGTTTDSDLHHIKILRGGLHYPPIEVDLASFIENGNLDAIPIIRPGDTVYVPKKGNCCPGFIRFRTRRNFHFQLFPGIQLMDHQKIRYSHTRIIRALLALVTVLTALGGYLSSRRSGIYLPSQSSIPHTQTFREHALQVLPMHLSQMHTMSRASTGTQVLLRT